MHKALDLFEHCVNVQTLLSIAWCNTSRDISALFQHTGSFST